MPKQDYPTPYQGIVIKCDPQLSLMFPEIVKEALAKIYSVATGKLLLDSIVASGQAKFGYKVAILRPEMAYGPTVNGKSDWKGGSRAVRQNEQNACNGTGVVTMVYWNPNVISNPDGARPSFVGLAHELVHALHNLNGDASADTKEEEARTVGLNQYLSVPPNENRIRKEHGVPGRTKYESEDFGTTVHDATTYGSL